MGSQKTMSHEGQEPEASGPAEPLLLEREAELDALRAAIAETCGGEGSAVVIEGAAGIGKTALLRTAADMAKTAEMRVLRARASELETGFAFGVVRQLLEPVLHRAEESERARLLEGAALLAGAALEDRRSVVLTGPDASFAASHGLYWLCVNLCEQSPVLLSVDDLHWADPPSLRFLEFLAPRLEEHRILLVVSARTEHRTVAATLGRLQALPHARSARPGALSENAVRRILTAQLGEPDPVFVHVCHTAVAGNPFLLNELIVELQHEGIPPTAAASERVLTIGPRAVSRIMLTRIASVGAQASAIAQATVILGDGAELRHAAALARIDITQAGQAADALVRASILCEGHRLAFVHPIVRQAVEQDMGPQERSLAHAAAAQLLIADGAPAERVALHLLAADATGKPAVVETLRAAAETALARGAPEVATRYLRRAHAEPPAAPARGSVLRELGRAELLSAEIAGLEHLRSALELMDEPTSYAEVALELAGFMVPAGMVRDAVGVLEVALARLGDRDRELRLRLLAAVTGIAITDLDMSAYAYQRLSNFDEPSGRTLAECKVLVLLAVSDTFLGRSAPHCVDLARRALSGGRLVREAATDPQTFLLATSVLMFCDELDEALDLFSTAIDTCRTAGASLSFAIHSCFRAWVAYRFGRLDDAEADLRTALSFTAVPMLGVIHGYAVSFLVDVLVERGDLDGAEATLQLHPPHFAQASTHDVTYVLVSRARLRLARRQPDAALHDLRDCSSRLRQWGIVNPAWNDWRSQAVLAHLASGDQKQAVALALEEHELSRTFGAPRTLGMALRSRALAEGGPTSIDLLREAAATLERSPAVLERARTLVDLGAALRRANRRTEARVPLRQGLDLACRCGASALVSRAHDELAATGARPRKDVLTGVEALTASELRIARMAADGMTNREIAQALFVTAKTVETHLGHVYAKLNIRSREGLDAALSARRAGASAGHG
jgi:DNA-binding CsgD family transcriptional regulator/tetratricopeptide (TPR) repeat protein